MARVYPLVAAGICLLFLSGCLQQEIVCATNNDCPSGTFCVNERCTSLSCSDEMRGCNSDSDCCKALECVNGKCEKIPELAGTARIVVGEDGSANVYGVSVKVGKVDPAFGENCSLLGGSAEINLGFNSDANSATVPNGGAMSAGKAALKLDALIGNATYGACEVKPKEAILGVTRDVSFKGPVKVGSGLNLWKGKVNLRVLKIEPGSNPENSCRYLRNVTLEIETNGESSTISVSNDKPVAAKNAMVILDPTSSLSSPDCLGPDPVIDINFVERDQIRLAEGTNAIALGDVNVRLDKLEAASLASPCKVTDATAHVSVNIAGSKDFGTVVLRKGEIGNFSELFFTIDDVRGEFTPSWKTCVLQGKQLLLSIVSPDGTGGTFATRTPPGSALFIEVETEREERTLSGECSTQGTDTIGYSFDTNKREFGLLSQKPNGPVAVAYGDVKRSTGDSKGMTSKLFTSNSIPFENGDVKVMGVNKDGDASLFYGGIALVISSGGKFTRESKSTEEYADCRLDVRTIETVKNYGFVKAPE